MVAEAVGISVEGRGVVESIRLQPQALLPRSARRALPWPRGVQTDNYRVPAQGALVTALDGSPSRGGTSFRVEGQAARFLVEAPPGAIVDVRLTRRHPIPADLFEWGSRRYALGSASDAHFQVRAEGDLRLGGMLLVPARIQAYGAAIGFSGSLGASSPTDSRAASPPERPRVINRSAPPDSGK
jgi:hypothetical protein